MLEADGNRADCNDRKRDGGGFDGVLKVEDLKGGEVSGFEGSRGGEGEVVPGNGASGLLTN